MESISGYDFCYLLNSTAYCTVLRHVLHCPVRTATTDYSAVHISFCRIILYTKVPTNWNLEMLPTFYVIKNKISG